MDGTKYNLSITTSGENGDHASTNISTSNPAQLADILQLAGMQGGHPVALGASEAPAPEEHGSCDVCGGMHEDEEHVVEGDSWDNEPDEVVHSPEEITQTGNDLHKVKKTYPKVNGGDNPMALENTENKLRQQFADFLAEDMEEEIAENVELVSPWAKQENDIEIIEEVEEVDEAAGKACKNKKHVVNKVETENKNMTDIRKLLDNIDSIESNGSTVVTEATTAEIQAQIAALQAQLAAQKAPDPWSAEGQAAMADRQQQRASQEGGRESGPAGSHTDDDYELDADGNVDRTKLKPGRAINVMGKAEKTSGPEGSSDEKHGSYTDADYDDQGNFIGTPLNVFGKAEVNTGGKEGASGTQYGSLPRQETTPRTDTIRARAEGLQSRMAAAREAGFPSLKAARAGGHPSGSEHTWTGSGAFEVGGPSDPSRTQAMGTPIPGADEVRREPAPKDDGYAVTTPLPSGEPVLATRISDPGPVSGNDEEMAPEVLGNIMADPELQDIVKLAGAPGGKHPDELGIGLAKDNRAGSKIDYSQEAIAKRQQARVAANAAGGGPEGSSDEKHGSAEFDKQGKIIGEPFKGPFTKAPKQTGRENNQSGGSATYDKETGKLTSKPVKVFTKAPKQTGRDE